MHLTRGMPAMVLTISAAEGTDLTVVAMDGHQAASASTPQPLDKRRYCVEAATPSCRAALQAASAPEASIALAALNSDSSVDRGRPPPWPRAAAAKGPAFVRATVISLSVLAGRTAACAL